MKRDSRRILLAILAIAVVTGVYYAVIFSFNYPGFQGPQAQLELGKG